MKTTKRKCPKDILIHCYQNTLNGFLLFYSVKDYLIAFMIICITARRWDVHILSLCLMPDHIHIVLTADSVRILSGFIRDYSKKLALEHNRTFGEKGQLFNHPFGSAPKYGPKKARTNLAYLGNNPIERQLCSKAEEYRWNFLAYASSDHPFSEKIIVRNASYNMKRALAQVNYMAGKHIPLSYTFLQRMFNSLDNKERNQITDHIITRYSVIDYQAAIRFFDSYDKMISAFHSNTGSEYDLNEVFTGRSDHWYSLITKLLLQKTNLHDIHEIFTFTDEKKFELLQMIMRETDCPPAQICKYLHLKISTER